MEYRAARPSERDQVLDLLALWRRDDPRQFGDFEKARQFFARYNHQDSTFRDDYCLLATDRGRIVSTVQIFARTVGLRGEPVPMGGIGSVFTREDARGCGGASELMRLAISTMEQSRFELSLLFAERLDFYASFGWQSIERLFSVVSEASQAVEGDWFEVAEFDLARDLEAIAEVHRGCSGRFDFTVWRDAAGWRGSLAFAGNPKEYFVVARDQRNRGAIAGYARAIRFYGFPMVMEYDIATGRWQR